MHLIHYLIFISIIKANFLFFIFVMHSIFQILQFQVINIIIKLYVLQYN